MKKRITLMFALMAIALGAQAMSYNIWIAGIQVTDDNKNNVTGGGIDWSGFSDGKVWFDPGHNTLYLENVRINGYSKEAIKSDIYGLTIKVKGRYNSLISSGSYGIYQSSNGTLTLEGDGLLDILADKSGIYINNAYCDLTLKDNVRVVVTTYNGAAVGVYGSTAVTGYCNIEGEKTMLLAETKAGEKTVEGFKDMILSDGISFNKPYTYYYGAYYDKNKRCVCLGGDPVGNEEGTLVIGKSFDINATNFPDEHLREKVRQFDTDGNNILDRDENYDARYLYLDTGNPDVPRNPDLEGLDLLYDLKTFEANLLEVEGITFHNSLLETIYLQNGKMTYLEMDECPWLQGLWCHGHNLSYLDLSNNKHLIDVSAGRNQLINIKLPSSFPNSLVALSIECNKLTESRMNTFINNLPQNTSGKEHYVNVTTSIGKEYFSAEAQEYYKEEGNVITQAQLQAMREKGWTPKFTLYHKGEWLRSEYYGALEYDLFVDAKKVNDYSKSDLMNDGGGMSYNHATNTLSIMSDYTFDTNAIQNYIPNLTIKTVDVSTLDCKSDAIDLYANTTFTGSYPLTLNSQLGAGIFSADGKTVTLDNANLNVYAPKGPGILGATTNGTQQLIINKSSVHVESNETSIAVSCYPGGILFNDCGIIEPVGGYVKDGDIVDKDGNWATNVTIQKASTFYPVYVAGRQVHNLNASDVLGDGTVSYNPDTKTLTLNNATINTDDESGIEFKEFGLNLELIGENHVHSVDGYPVYVGYDMRMVGDGSLEAVSDNNNAIYLFWGGLAVKENVKLTARGGKYGISGYATPYGNVGELHVLSSGAVVKASGPEGSIVALATLQLAEGVAITSPAGALFNETTGNVELRGSTVNGEVVISTNSFVFTLYDGVALTETYSNSQYNAVNVLLAGGELVEKYDEASQTTTYSKPSGKKLFVQEPYNNKGDKAFFLANQVEAADAISYDYSDDMESISSGVWSYSYQDGYDMDGALDFIDLYGSIVLNFGIPEVRPTEDMVIKIKDGMSGAHDFNLKQYAALMAMWRYFGAIKMVVENDNYVYKTIDGKTLCYLSSLTGIVTLAEGVTAADKVYYRILHNDREAIAGKTGENLIGHTFYFDEELKNVRSITLTVNEGSATAIDYVVYDTAEPCPTYNLSGQRVEGQPTHKGIYIINGKKVVVK